MQQPEQSQSQSQRPAATAAGHSTHVSSCSTSITLKLFRSLGGGISTVTTCSGGTRHTARGTRHNSHTVTIAQRL